MCVTHASGRTPQTESAAKEKILAALFSTGSRMGTAGYRAAPDPGWRVTPNSAAIGGFPLAVRVLCGNHEIGPTEVH